MGNGQAGDGEEDQPTFELADDPPRPADAPPGPRPPARAAKPRPPPANEKADVAEPPEGGPLAFLDDRRRRRLTVYGPVMLLLYLFLGWFFVGQGLGWFALAGIGIGLFAGWRRRGEILLGSLAAIAGFAACVLAAGRPSLFVIVGSGLIGYVAGIDDRLRNS
jgi:hypothetical protein